MKTAISIPDPVFEAADQLAKRMGVSRSELYASAIQAYVQAHRADDITEALNRIYGKEDSSLDPVLAALQSRALPGDDW
ncbi:MAG: ribbon-helix-helix domain-containing protein [Acidobacteriota bacterium]